MIIKGTRRDILPYGGITTAPTLFTSASKNLFFYLANEYEVELSNTGFNDFDRIQFAAVGERSGKTNVVYLTDNILEIDPKDYAIKECVYLSGKWTVKNTAGL